MGRYKQILLLWDEDRVIRVKRLTTEVGYIVDKTANQAWWLLHGFLFPMPSMGKSLVAMVTARNDLPVSPFGHLSPKDQTKVRNLDMIAGENLDRRLSKHDKDSKKNYMLQFLTIAVLGVIICFLAVAIMAMWQKGGFKMPWTH